MVKETTYEHISGSDGLKLSVLRIEPEEKENVRGVVQLVHGMCEHKGRYTDFMRYLAQNGYITVIHDHRGHGLSVKDPKDLGYFYEGGYHALIEDIHEITLEIKEYAGSDLPFILLGHSMGSLAVRCYIRKYDKELDALCVLGCPSELPGMDAGMALVQTLKKIKGERAHSHLMDLLVLGIPYDSKFRHEGRFCAWLSTDEELINSHNQDPLSMFTFTLNGYENLIRLTKLTYSGGYEAEKPDLPIRFFSGEDDPCAVSRKDLAKAVGYLKRAGYKNVKARMYEGMRHEILNERKRAKVYRDILEFIQSVS